MKGISLFPTSFTNSGIIRLWFLKIPDSLETVAWWSLPGKFQADVSKSKNKYLSIINIYICIYLQVIVVNYSLHDHRCQSLSINEIHVANLWGFNRNMCS